MKKFKRTAVSKYVLCWFVIIMLLCVLTGCGSSGSSSSDSGDSNSSLTITAELLNDAGEAITTISQGSPGTIRVTLNGSPVANQLIKVSTTKGSLSPEDGTALTDSNGVAELVLQAGDATGAGEVTVTVGDYSLETPLAFQIGAPPEVKLGAFIDGIFNEGVLATNVAQGEELSPGGTANITAVLVSLNDYNEYKIYQSPVDITFKTECTSAVIDPVVTTVDGSASTTYRADQCQGTSDTITANASIAGKTLTASTTINLASAEAGSVEFVSSDPELISLKGSADSAKPSTSIVKFLVKDTLGNPVKGEIVNFSLTTSAGGLTISPATAETDTDGIVQVIVSSGSQPTHVRVKATVNDTSITTLSDSLTISTGFPDQNSFSISADKLNPEALSYDGESVTITVRAADHFNNPVPDGTTISFITNGGVVDPSCSTVNGACSVDWRSQNPRPDNGRAVILATSVGEESFTDQNGSGLYEKDEDYFNISANDMPEAYIDVNGDDSHDLNEEFIDFNGNSSYDFGNGIYNGTLCSADSEATGGCTSELINVRNSIVLSMSGSYAKITFNPSSPITLNETTKISITISDVNGNSLPSDTTVDVTAPDNASIEGDSSFTVPDNTTKPSTFEVYLKPDNDNTGSATSTMQVKVTTPKGNITTTSFSVTVPAAT